VDTEGPGISLDPRLLKGSLVGWLVTKICIVFFSSKWYPDLARSWHHYVYFELCINLTKHFPWLDFEDLLRNLEKIPKTILSQSYPWGSSCSSLGAIAWAALGWHPCRMGSH
jgi:hypothetical protein